MEKLASEIVEAMSKNAPLLVIDIQHSDLVVGRLLVRMPAGGLVLLYERVELGTRHGEGTPVYSGLIQRLELGRDRRVAMHDSAPLLERSATPIRAEDMPRTGQAIATG